MSYTKDLKLSTRQKRISRNCRLATNSGTGYSQGKRSEETFIRTKNSFFNGCFWLQESAKCDPLMRPSHLKFWEHQFPRRRLSHYARIKVGIFANVQQNDTLVIIQYTTLVSYDSSTSMVSSSSLSSVTFTSLSPPDMES